MQGHQQKGRQNSTSSNIKDKSSTIIETSTAEEHDDEHIYFMRGPSLVELTEHDNSAADIVVHSMYQIRRRRRAARSLTSQGRAEPLCARIESANREVSEGKADL